MPSNPNETPYNLTVGDEDGAYNLTTLDDTPYGLTVTEDEGIYDLTVVEDDELVITLSGEQGPAGVTVWGPIEGNLADQLDLKAALDAKAPLASPVFTGNPTAPTAADRDNDTSIATTAFVQKELAAGTATAKNVEFEARNNTGSLIPKGSLVYINGGLGNKPLITLAQANNDPNSAQTIGFTKTDIPDNGNGFVITSGNLEGVKTFSATAGQQLYLSPSVAGTWTTDKPSAPQHLVYVGIVIEPSTGNSFNGLIYVAIQNGYELEELHDVAITSPSTGQVLRYDFGTGLWSNQTLATSTGGFGTADAGKFSVFGADGNLSASATTGAALSATSTSGVSVFGLSDTGVGGDFTTIDGNNHAEFGLFDDDRSFVARVLGAFGWFRGLFTGRIQAATTLTGNRTWTLPDQSGTISLSGHTHISSDISDATSSVIGGANKVARRDSSGRCYFSEVGTLSSGTGMVLGINTLDFRGGDPYSASSLVFPLSMDGVTWTLPDASGAVMLAEQNLSEITNPALARDALGSGIVGDELFVSETQGEAQAAIGLFPMSVEEYTSGSGQIALPENAKFVSFELVGGGGGGGSGCRQPTSTARSGGSGGRGGCRISVPPTPVANLTWPLLYGVGAGGAGGASILANGTNGQIGVSGGDTFIQNGVGGVAFRATGGERGNGGLLNANASGTTALTVSSGLVNGGLLGTTLGTQVASSVSNGTSTSTTNSFYATGGGSGGGITNGNIALLPGAGYHMGVPRVLEILGGAAGIAGSEIGKDGNTNPINKSGTGGGGGQAVSVTYAGSAGGNGGLYGGGGGGGSASVNGQPSGKGGDGAGGLIQVTFYY
jgi:hypothetical protein